MRFASILSCALIVGLLSGCGSGDPSSRLASPPPRESGGSGSSGGSNSDAATRRLASSSERTGERRPEVVAMLGATPLHWADLREIMIEAAGGDALSEWAMDKQIEAALGRANLRITQADVDRERRLLLEQLSDDADEATRLLDRVRRQRGLGTVRFQLLLRRNAGLRKLTEDSVEVNDRMVRQLYEQRFGPRAIARLIMVENVSDAARVKRRLDEGEAFIDLAVEMSIDSSGDRGGLLPEISPDDATFPSAIRDALEKLEEGAVSDPIALDGGFAILRVERKVERDESVTFEQAEASLRREVRLRNERTAMQQRARLLLEEADITVMDTQLERSWNEQRSEILRQQ